MERLTRCVGFRNGNPVYATNIDMRRIGAVDKLKNALGAYEDKEEYGMSVSLPCKDGDRVWYVDEYESSKIVGGTVDGYLWFRSCGFALNVVWDEPIMGPFAYMRKEMPFSEIGKTVFLSYEEAEAAMLKKDNK